MSTSEHEHQPTKKLSDSDHQELRKFTRRLRLAKRQLLLLSVEEQASSPVDRLRSLLLKLSSVEGSRRDEMSNLASQTGSNHGDQ
jgi:hypothetical protein